MISIRFVGVEREHSPVPSPHLDAVDESGEVAVAGPHHELPTCTGLAPGVVSVRFGDKGEAVVLLEGAPVAPQEGAEISDERPGGGVSPEIETARSGGVCVLGDIAAHDQRRGRRGPGVTRQALRLMTARGSEVELALAFDAAGEKRDSARLNKLGAHRSARGKGFEDSDQRVRTLGLGRCPWSPESRNGESGPQHGNSGRGSRGSSNPPLRSPPSPPLGSFAAVHCSGLGVYLYHLPMQRDSSAGPSSSPGGFAVVARRASRLWRLLGTAFGFAFTGILSLLLAFVVFPVLHALPGAREEKEVRAQLWVHRAARALMRSLELLGVLTMATQGAERLRSPGLLVVANHPTLLDALFLIAHMPQADCVVKASRFRNPFLSGTARGAGYVSNADGPRLVEGCVDRLLRGRSVIVFPEGTRSPAHGLGPFFRGAAHVALKAARDPLPVTLRCDPPALYRGRAWWDVPERRFEMRLEVGEPLILKDLFDAPVPLPRATRVVTDTLRDYFHKRLEHPALV